MLSRIQSMPVRRLDSAQHLGTRNMAVKRKMHAQVIEIIDMTKHAF